MFYHVSDYVTLSSVAHVRIVSFQYFVQLNLGSVSEPKHTVLILLLYIAVLFYDKGNNSYKGMYSN